jgi:hypothetical protein
MSAPCFCGMSVKSSGNRRSRERRRVAVRRSSGEDVIRAGQGTLESLDAGTQSVIRVNTR